MFSVFRIVLNRDYSTPFTPYENPYEGLRVEGGTSQPKALIHERLKPPLNCPLPQRHQKTCACSWVPIRGRNDISQHSLLVPIEFYIPESKTLLSILWALYSNFLTALCGAFYPEAEPPNFPRSSKPLCPTPQCGPYGVRPSCRGWGYLNTPKPET